MMLQSSHYSRSSSSCCCRYFIPHKIRDSIIIIIIHSFISTGSLSITSAAPFLHYNILCRPSTSSYTASCQPANISTIFDRSMMTYSLQLHDEYSANHHHVLSSLHPSCLISSAFSFNTLLHHHHHHHRCTTMYIHR